MVERSPTHYRRPAMTKHVPFPERNAEDLLTLAEVAEILTDPDEHPALVAPERHGPEFFKSAGAWSPPSATYAGSCASSVAPHDAG